MEELLPGVLHWTRVHDQIKVPVHSYYVADRLLLIDPMEPEEGLDAIAAHGEPERIALTVRHHQRHSRAFVDRFRCDIVVHEAGLHEFEGSDLHVEGFAWDEEIAPGIRALELGQICAEDTVLHIHAGLGALHFGDGLIRYDGQIGFVPDALIGEDAEGVKRRTIERVWELMDEDFDALLFAHGDPLASGGRDELGRFLQSHE